jgi:hypothetical protein
MNYDPVKTQYIKMCKIWTDRVIRHGGDNILILYKDHMPKFIDGFKSRANITYQKGIIDRQMGGRHAGHHNAIFKLPNLSSLNTEFIFIDCDMYVIKDLNILWNIRKDKPWIGVNHQWLPGHPDTHRKPFLNSGLQIVSDPKFYDYEKILKSHIKNKRELSVPGVDQAILFTWFKHQGYDYTHPEVGPAWNSCSAVGKLKKINGKWVGHTHGLKKDHTVYINHYWHNYKPWTIKCPLHASYNF